MSPTPCWSCGAARRPGAALCPVCGKVQPPPAQTPGVRLVVDKFATLGLPQEFRLDEGKLDEAFRALSRKLHPDRFVRAGVQERRYSLEQTTLLNDANRTLRDPVRRAEHLLELRGIELAREGEGPKMPLDFLEEAMEDREKLNEARQAGGADAVEALAQGVREKRDQTFAAVEKLVSAPGSDLAEAALLLARLRYYARYLDEAAGRPAEA